MSSAKLVLCRLVHMSAGLTYHLQKQRPLSPQPYHDQHGTVW